MISSELIKSTLRNIAVFLGPALDMTFKIYDSAFRLIETIHHDERVIINCEYDSDKDMLIMSGAAGEI